MEKYGIFNIKIYGGANEKFGDFKFIMGRT